jgi:hypothetical protein
MAVHGFILRVVPKGRVKRFLRIPSLFHCISDGVIPGSYGSAAQSYLSLAREGKMVGLSQNPDSVAPRRLRRAAVPTLIALALLCVYLAASPCLSAIYVLFTEPYGSV